MTTNQKHTGLFILLGLALVIALLLNISLGSVSIPVSDIVASLTGGEASKASWEQIIQIYRLPKAVTAIMAGSGLAVAGLLMQTFFRNPLAGPYVLGISSGASLGVAIFVLGGSMLGLSASGLLGKWGLIGAASIGSFSVLLLVLLVASRVKDTMALLIIGLMLGSLTGALVSVLAYFSKAEELQRYIFWSFGSLGDLGWSEISVMGYCFITGLLLAFLSSKSLNAFLLGDAYAKTLGVQQNVSRLTIIIASSLLAGSITAFAGPIAFIGLAVPHLIRQFIKTSNHLVLLPAVILGGAILMLLCDTIAQVPNSDYSLPINAITALVGAPIVIWLLVRKKKLIF